MKLLLTRTALVAVATLTFSTLALASNPLEEAMNNYRAGVPTAPAITPSGLAPEYQEFFTHLLAKKEAEKEAFLQEVAALRTQVKDVAAQGGAASSPKKPSNELDRAAKGAKKIGRDVGNLFKDKKDEAKEPAPSFASTLPAPLQHTLQAPDDFSSALYGMLNPDVQEAAQKDGQNVTDFLTAHFVTLGVNEGRAYH